MVGKLAVVAAGMFAFGYALVPIYKHICEALGINILALGERQVPGGSARGANTRWTQPHDHRGVRARARPCSSRRRPPCRCTPGSPP